MTPKETAARHLALLKRMHRASIRLEASWIAFYKKAGRATLKGILEAEIKFCDDLEALRKAKP